MVYLRPASANKVAPYVLVFLAATCFLLVVRLNNLGTSPDSVQYIEAARNVSAGKGVTLDNGQLVNHWPPLYPILLGVSSYISMTDVLSSGKYLHFILMIALGCIYILILKELEFSKFLILVLPPLLLAALPLTVSVMFWSELTFITLQMGMVLFGVKWVKDKRVVNLLLAGTMCGLSCMTRYAGVGLAAGFGLFLLMPHDNINRKTKHIVFYSMPIALISLAWYLYTQSFARSVMDREAVTHLIGVDKLMESIDAFRTWFISDHWISLITMLIWVITAIYFSYKNRFSYGPFLRKYKGTLQLLGTLIIFYYLFLLTSISLFDAYTPLDNRTLAPIFPMLLILIGLVLEFLYENVNQKIISASVLGLFAISLLSSSFNSWSNHYHYGSGYTGIIYRNYPSIIDAYISSDSPVQTFTNGTDVIAFFSRTSTRNIPVKIYPTNKKVNDNYARQLDEMVNSIEAGKAQLIYFDAITWRDYYVSKAELLERLADCDKQYFEGGVLIRSFKMRANDNHR